jgi:phage repressor protein C with HTH and peptisase S24 domain
MSTLGERVREERETHRWSQQRLADEVTRRGFKIGQSAVGNIESRGDTDPKCIVQLAAALGVSVTWLQTGKGDKRVGVPQIEPMPLPLPSTRMHMIDPMLAGERPDVPVWASAEAGSEGAMVLTSEPIDYIRRSERMQGVRNPFAFYVIGTSMSPAIEHGDQVVVNPTFPPRPGADCVFLQEQADGSQLALVKRLLRSGPEGWRVRQFNEPRDFELSRKKWSKALVISEIRRGGL